MTITIKNGNCLPGGDGDTNRYISPEVSCEPWFDRAREVVFMNGMANEPKHHVESAIYLSMVQGCPVIGIYNLSDGTGGDLVQCLLDKFTLVDPQSGNLDAWIKAFDETFAKEKAKDASLTRTAFAERLIAKNPATVSLFRYVIAQPEDKRAKLKIFCHSQGNLITSNALTAVAIANGRDAIKGLEVNSFGSPCRYWPPGLKRTNYAFTFDLVSMMDYNVGFDSVKVGLTPGLFAHGFNTYLNHDAEFIVNRFRWGGLRATASMDEEGLANYLVRIGNNPRRLKKIFGWLDDKHNSDADDVAVIYTRTMRTRNPGVMQSLADADKDLIELLMKCMVEGITTSDERIEIDYLDSLR